MQAVDLKRPPAVRADAVPALCDAAGQPKKLQQLVAEAIAVRRYSKRTNEAYWHWIKRFVLWSGKRHPRDMGQTEVGQFLTWLASDQQVTASTQRQALAAVLFLYQKVLDIDIGWVEGIVRAKQSQRLPVVMTMDETRALLAHTSGTPGLFLRLLYGTGLRLMEGLNLRVKDLDLDQRQIIVRAGKGNKDRVTMLPASLVQPLRELIEGSFPISSGFSASASCQSRKLQATLNAFDSLVGCRVLKPRVARRVGHAEAIHEHHACHDLRRARTQAQKLGQGRELIGGHSSMKSQQLNMPMLTCPSA